MPRVDKEKPAHWLYGVYWLNLKDLYDGKICFTRLKSMIKYNITTQRKFRQFLDKK